MFLNINGYVKTNVEDSISNLDEKGNLVIKNLKLDIPKPDIPADIVANYKAIEVQKTEQSKALEQQKTEKIRKDTDIMKVEMDAEQERTKQLLEIEAEEKKKIKLQSLGEDHDGDSDLSDVESDQEAYFQDDNIQGKQCCNKWWDHKCITFCP